MMDRYKKFFSANRELTLFWGSLLSFLFLFLTLGLYLIFESKNNFNEAKMLQERLQAIRRFQQSHPNYTEYAKDLDKRWGLLEAKIPQHVDSGELLLEINSLAAYLGIKVDELQSIGEHKLQITCQGQCQAILDFMKKVETQDNLLLFSDVIMESRENDMVALIGTINYFTAPKNRKEKL